MPAYTYTCEEHGNFEIRRSIHDRSTVSEPCPICGKYGKRNLRADTTQEPIYNAQGFHRTDYWKTHPGRNQPADKKEWLNSNWSRHYNEPPPPPDSKGTYDGT